MGTKRKKILVTGGSGFIGSNLIEELKALNHDIINIDLQKSQLNVPTKMISVNDYPRLKKVFDNLENTNLHRLI